MNKPTIWMAGQLVSRWVLMCWLLLMGVSASAVESPEEPVDVRVIIDISGSMKETDPANLRVPALNLVVELLPDGARSGVWTFGQFVNMLVPLDDVDSGWRARAREAALQINSAGQRTDLTSALDKASWQISADSAYQQSVILLTDGKIDVAAGGPDAPANRAARQRLVNDILPRYQAAGARIHTLALSDAADLALLEQIALESDGLFLKAEDADELSRVFMQAFDRSAPAEQVPLQGNRFSIDASVREFTALVFRKPGAAATRLIAPSGEVLGFNDSGESVRWHRDLNFDLITVSAPEPGEWQLDAEIDPDNQVRILSDLKLRVEGITPTIFSGDPLDVSMALTNEGILVDEAALLGLTDFTLSVTQPDGQTLSLLLSDPENLPADGVFMETLGRFDQPGLYQFELLAQGRTFSRQRQMTANLVEPFQVTLEEDIDNQTAIARVVPQADMVDASLSRVLVRTFFPDGSSKIQPMDATDQGWAFPLQAEAGEGLYVLELNIRGVTTSGKTFHSQPASLEVNFPLEVKAVRVDTDSQPPAPNGEKGTANGEPDEKEVEQPAAEDEAEAAASEPKATLDKQQDAATLGTDEVADPESESSGMLMWILIAGGVVLVLVLGAGGWWWLRRKKRAAAAAMAADGAAAGSEEVDEKVIAEKIQNMDDFEAFMSEGEEQIKQGVTPSATESEPEETPDTIDSDTNIDPLADADTADAGLGDVSEDDDWGDFDLDDDNNNGERRE